MKIDDYEIEDIPFERRVSHTNESEKIYRVHPPEGGVTYISERTLINLLKEKIAANDGLLKEKLKTYD